MVQQSTNLGGTASNVSVGRVAHGLMMMTWIPTPVPDEQCFEAIKAGIDALPAGTKMFLNSADFYAQDLGPANLEMLSRFFAKYPEYADKTFLSVKGAIKDRAPANSPENIRASVERSQKALGPIKKIDLFQPARVDHSEGKFAHVGISECHADTLRKVSALHPITAVEIEISPFAYEENQKKVIATATELGISVLAYSPLGRGVLGGNIKSQADLPEGDMRHRFTRFKDAEILKHNLTIVEALEKIGKAKGVTVAQLCIAWVAALSPRVIPLPGSSKATRTLENLEAGDIVLSTEELTTINDTLATLGAQVHLWG
ncbi:aldo/keto reductase [Mycena filopes]|nr:aldo/keto reductase [Mycena filopes]